MDDMERMESELNARRGQVRRRDSVVLKSSRNRSTMSNLLSQLDALEGIIPQTAVNTLRDTVIAAILETTIVNNNNNTNKK